MYYQVHTVSDKHRVSEANMTRIAQNLQRSFDYNIIQLHKEIPLPMNSAITSRSSEEFSDIIQVIYKTYNKIKQLKDTEAERLFIKWSHQWFMLTANYIKRGEVMREYDNVSWVFFYFVEYIIFGDTMQIDLGKTLIKIFSYEGIPNQTAFIVPQALEKLTEIHRVHLFLVIQPMLKQTITLSYRFIFGNLREKAIKAWVNSVRLIIKQEVD